MKNEFAIQLNWVHIFAKFSSAFIYSVPVSLNLAAVKSEATDDVGPNDLRNLEGIHPVTSRTEGNEYITSMADSFPKLQIKTSEPVREEMNVPKEASLDMQHLPDDVSNAKSKSSYAENQVFDKQTTKQSLSDPSTEKNQFGTSIMLTVHRSVGSNSDVQSEHNSTSKVFLGKSHSFRCYRFTGN